MLTKEEFIKEFPFLEYSKENEWCYGNCDIEGWQDNLDPGWLTAFGENLFREIKDCLVKYGFLDYFQIHQLKEKWSELRLYYGFYTNKLSAAGISTVPRELYKKLDEIIDKYGDLSCKTCCVCGKPARYRTLGYILPYCEDCIKPNWRYKEIKEED